MLHLPGLDIRNERVSPNDLQLAEVCQGTKVKHEWNQGQNLETVKRSPNRSNFERYSIMVFSVGHLGGIKAWLWDMMTMAFCASLFLALNYFGSLIEVLFFEKKYQKVFGPKYHRWCKKYFVAPRCCSSGTIGLG